MNGRLNFRGLGTGRLKFLGLGNKGGGAWGQAEMRKSGNEGCEFSQSLQKIL